MAIQPLCCAGIAITWPACEIALERQYIDGQTGICVNPSMVDFKIPSILDVPAVEPIIVEPDDPYGPFGAKGVGEPPYSIPAPAIANAIYNAVGVRCNEIPINIRAIIDGLAKG